MKVKRYNEGPPYCLDCKDMSLEFDMNILKGHKLFRKGHDDAFFECPGCGRTFLVEDYTDEAS